MATNHPPEDGRGSPSSATSTSRLLAESTSNPSSSLSSEQEALQGTPAVSRPRQYNERKTSRVFIHRVPSSANSISSSSRSSRHFHSCENVHNGTQYQYNDYNSDVFLPPSTTHIPQRSDLYRSTRVGGHQYSHVSRLSRTSSVGGLSFVSRTSSFSDIIATFPLHQSSITDEAVSKINRSSTRRSIGQEWTRHHWNKMKDLEQESERARRCSKLSSGFAPLMVFGGLVFVCIGISASTNTGKDRERLKQLSAAPLAMGIFMLFLGVFLICSWFSCRARAKQIDMKVLHGSRRNSPSVENNLIQTIFSKVHSQLERTGFGGSNRPPTPTISGIMMDGVMVHKVPNNKLSANSKTDLREQRRWEPLVVRETSL